jgi:hypothetical protein
MKNIESNSFRWMITQNIECTDYFIMFDTKNM